MEEYVECYLAHLDVLGFKNLIKEKECQEILNIYRNFCNPVENFNLRVHGNSAHQIEIGTDVKMKIMSDSICFFIRSDFPNALFQLLMCCGSFQTRLLELSPPVLIRGAIAVGKLYAEGDITFGPVLTKAYIMQEELAKYPRIILTRELVEQGATNIKDPKFKNLFYGMVFRDEDEFCVVNQIELKKGWEPDGIYYTTLMQHISKVLDSTIDNSIREKYLYLKKTCLQRYNLRRGLNA